MNKSVFVSFLAVAAALPLPAYSETQNHTAAGGQGPGKLVVTYDGSVSALSLGPRLASSEILEVGTENIEAVKAQLASMPGVLKVEEDHWVSNPPLPSQPKPLSDVVGALSTQPEYSVQQASATPSDPGFSSQIAWQEPRSGRQGVQDIFAAYSLATPSRPVRIGVVDSGFYAIEDLRYAQGYNFASADGFSGRYLENEIAPDCRTSHGTGVSGVFGAITNNGTGIAGITNAEIIAARALSCDSSGRVRGVLTDTALAIRWLAGDPSVSQAPRLQNPVDVINASIGSQVSRCPGYLQDAIDYAYNKGILTVVAAGNAGENAANMSPANCRRVVTVAAVQASGDLAGFSNVGANINVAALGTEVLSLDRLGRLTFWDGTSFSSPIVAGIAGLLRQSSSTELTPSALADILQSTARSVIQPDGSRVPVVDAKAALARISAKPRPATASITPFLNSPERCQTDAYVRNSPQGIALSRVHEVNAKNLPVVSGQERYTVFASTSTGSKQMVQQSQETVFLVRDVDPASQDLWIDICDTRGSNCRFNKSQELL